MQVTRNPTTVVYTNTRLPFSSYEKSVSRQLLTLVQMLNNVKANVPGILLAFLNISTQDRKKEEEDRQHQHEKSKSLKKKKRKKEKKRLS